jgi:hypothetical protein
VGFVWDDLYVVRDNAFLDVPFTKAIVELWGRDFGMEIVGHPVGYYRPIKTLSLVLTSALFGHHSAWPYVLTNVLLHAVNAMLLAPVLRRMLQTQAMGAWPVDGALLGACFFAVAGWTAETAINIPARGESLGLLWNLLGFLAGVRVLESRSWRQVVGWGGLSFLFVVLAGLSKETALVPALMAVVMTIILTPSHQRVRAGIRMALIVGSALTVVMVARHLAQIQPTFHPMAHLMLLDPMALLRWITTYAWQVLAPVEPLMVLPRDAGWTHPGASSLTLVLSILAACFWGVQGWWAWKQAPVFLLLAVLWIVLTLGPVMLVHASDPTYALTERFLYLPGVSLAVIVAAAWSQPPVSSRVRQRWLVGLVILLLIHSVLGFQTARCWSHGALFWGGVVAKQPEFPHARMHLAGALEDLGRPLEARKVLEEALVRSVYPVEQGRIRARLERLTTASQTLKR